MGFNSAFKGLKWIQLEIRYISWPHIILYPNLRTSLFFISLQLEAFRPVTYISEQKYNIAFVILLFADM